LRHEIARAQSIPPYAVFAERSLMEMATTMPTTPKAFIAINGVGTYKLQAYGERFMQLIASFATAGNVALNNVALNEEEKKKASAEGSIAESAKLFAQKMNLAQIALERKLTVSTIVNHLVAAFKEGTIPPPIDLSHLISHERRSAIERVIRDIGGDRIKPFKEQLPEEFTYEEIRLVFAALTAAS
jgi:ATP-dependent DNA helicase RecQ